MLSFGPRRAHARRREKPILWVLLLLYSSSFSGPQRVAGEEPSPEHCMGTEQLREAVDAAAWSTTVGGSRHSAIILTTCDLHCLKMLFEPWMWSIQHSRDGDFSQHVVVVGNGPEAHAHCEALRRRHRHRCLLDRMCPPPRAPAPQPQDQGGAPSSSLGSPLYFLALLQKIRWAQEVLRLGLAVLWSDMDVFFFGNPLPFMFSLEPETADLVIQTEFWNIHQMFKGDACKFAPGSVGCKNPQHPGEPRPLCCGMQINGGLWLAHPRPRGRQLLRVWEAAVFHDSIVQGKAWDRSAVLDQYVLERILGNQAPSAPLFTWDAVQGRYVPDGDAVWEPEATVVYRTSAQRTQSRCFGECGYRGPNVGYRYHTICHGERREGTLCFGAVGGAEGDGGGLEHGTQLVCAMPAKQRERVVSIHQNCAVDAAYKQAAMLHWRNWTADEAGYEEAATRDPGQRVVPEW